MVSVTSIIFLNCHCNSQSQLVYISAVKIGHKTNCYNLQQAYIIQVTDSCGE